MPLVRAIGADEVLDYTCHDLALAGHRYDVILDTAGNRRLSSLRRVLAPSGRLVIVGGETSGRWLGGVDRQLRAMLLSRFVRQRLTVFLTSDRRTDLEELQRLVDGGSVRPVLDRRFPLAEVPQAIRHLRSGHARGKIVIVP